MQSQKLSKIFIGCDHAAFEMKQLIIEFLISKNVKYEDKGTYSKESCDYPDFAQAVCKSLLAEPNSLGILICGSGVGISIAANKVKGIRCGLCHDYYTALMARTKDHCNVIAFGARVIGIEIAKQIVDTFITVEPLQDEQYLKRIQLIKQIEDLQ